MEIIDVNDHRSLPLELLLNDRTNDQEIDRDSREALARILIP